MADDKKLDDFGESDRRRNGGREAVLYVTTENAPTSTADGHQYLNLSIFILLLAFFVVLNVHSEVDTERVRPVMSSLEQQFQLSTGAAPSDVDAQGQEGPGSTLDVVTGIFNAASISFKIRKIDGDDIFIVVLSRRDFDEALSQAVEGAIVQGKPKPGNIYARHARLFTQLSVMLAPREGQYGYHMTVQSNTDDPGKPHRSEIEALKKYQSSLKHLGFLDEVVSYGFTPRIRGEVHLYFQPHAHIL
ncbi:MAG: hypothetical protein HND56_11275 [Pseudomonadota bacterium]|nr:hypothetical protein [Pseudomonadota bacterium]QKK06232.1 MAG: hypothetical protein HND56_11275 [Pseudomonadota bacterium]